jgi:peptide/nickel transport system substrate-binding protein
MRGTGRLLTILCVIGLLAGLAGGVMAQPVAELRLPGGGYWGHPNPFGINRGPGYLRASLVFDTLVWRDASGETIPWLAEDWSLADDGVTWTFRLRDDIRWQDGKPFTAEDVVFSIEYYLANPGTAWFMAQINMIETATASDTYTVEIRLKQPFAPFIATTAESLFMLPAHIWRGVADPRTFTAPEAFIGTGAYRLVAYSEAEGSYLFAANEDFFLGAPYVRSIAFIPSGDAIVALTSGAVDAFDQFGGVTEEMLAPFRAAPYGIGMAPGEWGMFLYFNQREDTPLADAQVRQAIAHAVDRQALVERALFDFGEAGSMGFLPPANPYFHAGLPDYAFDPAAAQALLAAAGYDGTPLRLSHSTSTSPRIVEIVQRNLEDAGLNIVPVAMDQASLDAAAIAGDYEIGLFGFGGLGGDPDQLRRNFASDSPARGFTRALGYANAQFDALAGTQVGMTDVAERLAAIAEMQAILAEDLPVLPLFYSDRVVVFNGDIFDNWTFTPGGWGGGIPLPYNKHQFIVGVPTGLEIRQ